MSEEGLVLRLSESPQSVEFLIDGSSPVTIRFSSEHPLSGNFDAGLAAALLFAMLERTPLHVRGSASSRLMGAIPRIQEIFSDFRSEFGIVPVITGGEDAGLPDVERGAGVLFSLGVDSSFTAMSNLDHVSHLIFVEGFDLRRLSPGMWRRLRDTAEQAAVMMSKELVVVETNIRELSRAGVGWRWLHGPALASVGHLLRSDIEKLYISSSRRYSESFAWGTHPVVDPLWSSEWLEVIHYGAHVSRFEKLEWLVERDDRVLDWLRVCSAGGERLNCGTCGKCLRAMVALDALGVLGSARTFPDHIDVSLLAQIDSQRRDGRIATLDLLKFLKERSGVDQYRSALELTLHSARDSVPIR